MSAAGFAITMGDTGPELSPHNRENADEKRDISKACPLASTTASTSPTESPVMTSMAELVGVLGSLSDEQRQLLQADLNDAIEAILAKAGTAASLSSKEPTRAQ
jgi:hypothetical protein